MGTNHPILDGRRQYLLQPTNQSPTGSVCVHICVSMCVFPGTYLHTQALYRIIKPNQPLRDWRKDRWRTECGKIHSFSWWFLNHLQRASTQIFLSLQKNLFCCKWIDSLPFTADLSCFLLKFTQFKGKATKWSAVANLTLQLKRMTEGGRSKAEAHPFMSTHESASGYRMCEARVFTWRLERDSTKALSAAPMGGTTSGTTSLLLSQGFRV